MFTGSVNAIGLKTVETKLLLATPRILEENRALATSMLEFVKAEVVPEMPIGPGHFGDHARFSFKIEVKSAGIKTWGVLKGAVQAFWREFGTLGRYRRGGLATAGMAKAALYAATVGTGGEPPRPIAHKALAGARKFIEFYYGSQKAYWWRL